MCRRSLPTLLDEIRGCRVCETALPLGPRPVLAAHRSARVLIAGQAPGKRVHQSGVAWRDPSGDRLRAWLGLDDETFYDPRRVALVPMGFCYPGTGSGGDLPPRPECAETWHGRLLPLLASVRLTVVIGRYAQAYHLGDRAAPGVTETVADWRRFAPAVIPLPHPSPRNQRWLARNPWFETELVPVLRRAVRAALA
ncbi:MAG: uracil-DNA glycosylase family protein [Gemmatimonadales bacterium]